MDKNEQKTIDLDKEAEGLPVVRPNVAGIDLGSQEHWVCAPRVDGTGREVARFGATTPDLEEMAAWLLERKVESVAMEGTRVYWIAPQKYWRRRTEALLVNTRELARCPGEEDRSGGQQMDPAAA
jgi:hypothetical protein